MRAARYDARGGMPMKNVSQLGIFLIAACICAVLIAIFCTWFWLDAACLNPQRRIYMKQAGAVGCFEYWLYRYQGLLGNVLTAGVAGVTLIWVKRQLVPASEQADIAKATALNERVLPQLQRGIANVKDMRKSLHSALAAQGWPDDLDEFLHRAERQVWALLKLASESIALVEAIADGSNNKKLPKIPGLLEEQKKGLARCGGTLAEYRSNDKADLRLAEPDDLRLHAENVVGDAMAAIRAIDAQLKRALDILETERGAAGRSMRRRYEQALGPWWRE